MFVTLYKNRALHPRSLESVLSLYYSYFHVETGQMLAGKWLLNFFWRMEGFDVQFDPSIGHQLSALANTLTSLAGNDEDIADLNSVMDSNEESTIQPVPEVRRGQKGSSTVFKRHLSSRSLSILYMLGIVNSHHQLRE